MTMVGFGSYWVLAVAASFAVAALAAWLSPIGFYEALVLVAAVDAAGSRAFTSWRLEVRREELDQRLKDATRTVLRGPRP